MIASDAAAVHALRSRPGIPQSEVTTPRHKAESKILNGIPPKTKGAPVVQTNSGSGRDLPGCLSRTTRGPGEGPRAGGAPCPGRGASAGRGGAGRSGDGAAHRGVFNAAREQRCGLLLLLRGQEPPDAGRPSICTGAAAEPRPAASCEAQNLVGDNLELERSAVEPLRVGRGADPALLPRDPALTGRAGDARAGLWRGKVVGAAPGGMRRRVRGQWPRGSSAGST